MFFKLIDIKKEYKIAGKKIRALNGINLDINQGDYITFVGPSGAGKTTLLSIIAGLIKPTSGDIYFNSKKLTRLPDHQWSLMRKNHIGFIFQNRILISHLSIYENIIIPLYFLDNNDKKKELLNKTNELIEKFELTEFLNFKPEKLSGGEIQKVVIARALATNPDILLADEPTGDLDIESSKNLIKIFKELNKKGLTIVMVTHNYELAYSANTIYKINKGEIVKLIK